MPGTIQTTVTTTPNNNPNPPQNYGDALVISNDELKIIGVTTIAAAFLGAEAAPLIIIIGAAGTVALATIEVMKKEEDGQDVWEANVSSYGAGAVNIAMSFISTAGLAANLAVNYVSTVIGHLVDIGIQNNWSGQTFNNTTNNLNNTTFNLNYGNATITTPITNIEDLETIVNPITPYVYKTEIQTPNATYIVQAGDSPYSILSQYGIPQTEANLDKFLAANPNIVTEGRVSADKKFVLLKKQETITIPKEFIKPVDYSQLVEHAQAVANGTASSVVDLQIFDRAA